MIAQDSPEFSTLVEALCAHALNSPEKIALTYLSEEGSAPVSFSYQQLDLHARAIARELKAHASPGDRALLLYNSGLEFVAAFFGCLYAGLIAVPAYPPRRNRKLDRLESIVKDCHAQVVLTTAQLMRLAQPMFAEVKELASLHWIAYEQVDLTGAGEWNPVSPLPEHLAFLQYTSGSTGTPKGVMVSHHNLAINCEMIARAYVFSRDEIFVGWLPLFHDMGLIGQTLTAIFRGYALYFMSPAAFLKNPVCWLKAISTYRATSTSAPNFAYELCVKEITDSQREELDLSSLVSMTCGAEPVNPDTVRRFIAAYEPCGFSPQAFKPNYGLAEATLYVTGYLSCQFIELDENELEQNRVVRSRDGQHSKTLTGTGIPMMKGRVLIVDPDECVQTQPGRVGEIWVAGPHVAQGYWQKTEETEATFRAYLADTSEGPFLRTGDLGFIEEGNLFVTGRLKDLIIINGSNYYPHDIEYLVENMSYLTGNPALPMFDTGCAAAFTLDTPDAPLILLAELNRHYLRDIKRQQKLIDAGQKVSSPVISPALVATTIGGLITETYEIRVADVVFLKTGTLPKTSSGKVQRRLAKQKYCAGDLDVVWSGYGESRHVSATTFNLPHYPDKDSALGTFFTLDDLAADERMLADWMIERLALQLGCSPAEIDINSSFFELGVDSIAVMRVTGALEQHLKHRLPVSVMWDYPTLVGLVKVLSQDLSSLSEHLYQIPVQVRADKNTQYDPFNLSEIQQAYWFGRGDAFELGNVAAHYYAEFNAVELDFERLESSWQKVIERHAMLKATFLPDGRQIVHEWVEEYRMDHVDLTQMNQTEREQLLIDVRHEMSARVHDPEVWPLFEIKVYDLPGSYRIFFEIDMLIADLESIVLIMKELNEFYVHPDHSPPALEFSYRDYICALESHFEGAHYEEARKYWDKRLQNFPNAPVLPLAKSPRDLKKPDFSRYMGKLPHDQWKTLKERCRNIGVTPSMVLCAVYAEVIGRWSRNDRFLINLVLFNRQPFHPDVDCLVGDFTSLSLLEIDQTHQNSFESRCHSIQKQFWEDLEYRDISGAHLMRDLRKISGGECVSVPVVFTSSLGIEDNLFDAKNLGQWLTHQYSVMQTPQVWIDHQVLESNGSLYYSWDVVEELFPDGLIEEMFEAYESFLGRLSENDREWLQQPNLIPKKQLMQRQRINATYADLPDMTLDACFVRQAKSIPEHYAIISSEGVLTYRELDEMSNQLAHCLLSKKTQLANQHVVVMMEKGWEQVVACLGIVKAGAAYVPLDADLPKERRLMLLDNSGAKWVITQPWLKETLEWPDSIEIMTVDEERLSSFSRERLPLYSRPDQLAYTIYTSGSTGFPKGVMIEHCGAVNTILDINERFGVTSRDRILAVSSLSFDLSVYDIFGALAAGATIVIPDAAFQRDSKHLGSVLSQWNVTLWNSAPVIMTNLVNYAEAINETFFDNLRLVLLSGDWIPTALPGKIWEQNPEVEVVSLGGATEASIWSICFPIKEVNASWRSIPYGKPLRNQQIWVLDANLSHCPDRVPGEIYIGGAGLSRGYWLDSKKTDQRFVYNPYTGERLYRTGDMGCYLEDGNVEFLGREDDQVKLRGHRVELGEIESILNQHPAIKRSLVNTVVDKRGNQQLVAYIISFLDIARIDLEVPCLITPQKAESGFKAKTFDISASGLAVEIQEEQLSRGDNCQVLIDLPGVSESQNLNAEVVWTRANQAGLMLDQNSRSLAALQQSIRYILRSQGFALMRLQHEGDSTGLHSIERAPFRHLCAVDNHEKQQQQELMAVSLSARGIEFIECPDHWLSGDAVSITLPALEGEHAISVDASILWHTGKYAMMVFDTTSESIARIAERVKNVIQNEGHWYSRYSITSVSDYLKDRLPHYMVPHYFILLDAFPLNFNGKINRKALPVPQLDDFEESGDVIVLQQRPETPTEIALAEIWESVLSIQQVSRNDNYFELGGNSIQLTQVAAEITRRFSIEVPLRLLFSLNKLKDHAKLVDEQVSLNDTAALKPISNQGEENSFPLSMSQQRLWFLDQMLDDGSFYNISAVRRLNGVVNTDILESVINEIIHRHDSLTTRFVETREGVRQMVEKPERFTLPVINLMSDPNKEQVLKEYIHKYYHWQFDLSSAPLFKIVLVQTALNECYLIVVFHHIVADGWSVRIFVNELQQLYRSKALGQPFTLPRPIIRYVDYAVWHREWFEQTVFEDQLNYWRKNLEGYTSLNFPTDKKRPLIQSYSGKTLGFVIDPDLEAKIRSHCTRYRVTPFIYFLSMFYLLLSRYSGQKDISIGTVNANRTRPETQDLIGFFVNTLVMRIKGEALVSVSELLRRVKEVSLEAYLNMDFPFEKLVEVLNIPRDTSRTPIFQVMFTLQNLQVDKISLPDIEIEPVQFDTASSKFDLTLELVEQEKGLIGSIEYATSLFDEQTIQTLIVRYQSLLEQVSSHEDMALSDIDILTHQEKIWIRENTTGAVLPIQIESVVSAFEQVARDFPGRLCVEDATQTLTYAQVDSWSTKLAHLIRKLNVGTCPRIGLSVERSVQMVVGMLAILKAGYAYVPIDPHYPLTRIRHCLEDAGLELVVLHTATEALYRESAVKRLNLDLPVEFSPSSLDTPLPHIKKSDPIYVIYTSGSTGVPKGVEVEHVGMANLCQWHQRVFDLSPQSRATQVAGMGFDACGWEIWPYITAGASVTVVDRETLLDPGAILHFLVSRKITHCFMPTPIAELLIDACWPAESELRFMLTGGDRLKHHPADSLPFTLVNNYGPTEVSVVSTSGNVPSGQAGFPTIGRPVDNLSVYILDAALQRVPPGVPGEVCIAGPGVARGYLNQPEATCKVFVENPYSERTEDARLYQTGDIARLTANGEIEYIGREDFQVKIRGNRIELGEIEAVLKEVESIADVVVLVREDFHDSATLVAYYTVKSGGAVDPDTLQSTLRARLPDYMIPAYCVRMTEFSLTANGKIDRHHLPKPTQEEGMITEIPVAPRNETERVMAEIWQEVIGVSTVGINQNFFELGGHSLKAARLVSRIQSELGYQVPVKTVFEAPTIERLMARIQIADALQEGHFLPIFRRDKSQHYPLSFAQQRLWFLSRLDTENSAYNITGAARLVGNLNLEIFRQALEEVIQRHEVLRSNFIEHDGEPVVTLSDFSSLELVIERLPAQSGEAQEAFFRQVLSEEQHYTFDLEHEHLIRLRLVEIEPNDHRLIVNVHHIVADGWSIGLLIKEVGELYSNKVEFGQFHLPPLVIQYGDYAIWNRESICSDGYEIALNYWLKKLDASLPLEVMTDYPRQTDSENRSCSADTLIHSDIAGRLNALAIKNSCSLFMVLLAGFDVLMSRLSGQYDFCVGAPVANRPDKNCEQLIGMFMNTVVFRMNFSEKDSFHSILKHVKQTTLEAYEHQNVPFEHIVEKLDLPKDLTRTPLFQIFFNMLNFPVHALSMAGVEVEIYDMPDSPGKFDMTFYLEESQDGITVRVIYDANLYKQTTIEMLLALYASTLEAVTLFPDKRVGELELTHPDAVPALPDPTDPILIRDVPSVLERFMTSVDHFGEKVAIESPYEKITYRDIYLRIVTLMSALQAKGAGTEARIAILAGRHPALVTSMCATLGIHATFVIIDPDYPIERITQMLEIADPLLLILAVENRDEAIQALLDSVSIPIVDALALHSDPEVSQRSDLASTTGERLTDNALDAPAYIAFTSGTTGRPKAMMGAQRPLAHFIDWHLSTHNLTHEDRFSMVSGLSHDPLLRDIFTPLSVGATLCIPDHEIYSDGVKLARWVCETNVTVSHLTPAMAQYLVESAGEMQTTALRYAFMAGDVLRAEHIHALKHFAPNIGVVNFYGSTETPQAMSAYRVPDGYDGARIPLGHGIEGVQLLVVNSAGKVASPGEVGEIWIRTPYLTQGYLDSDSTARNFIENPWRKESQDRLYCTGDMGRYRQDGEVEFLGRRDTQVKIRGYRVELSEVDAVLASHPEIKKSVTVAISREEDSPFLVSYCVPLQTTELPDSSLLRQFVSTRLPSYMVPDRCIALQSFPLTPNGKVDLRKLPAPESVDRTSAPYEPPETETESVLAKIWCEVLNCDRVSRWDDFFELGGHSLLATRVVARIKKEKSVSVPVKMLFEHSTLRELSCRVDELQALLAQPDEFNDPNDPECVEFRL